jgi:hypothetical protein
MSNSILLKENKEQEEQEYIYIQGVKISDDEEEITNNLINYVPDDKDPIFFYFPCDEPIFKINNNINWYKLNYEVIERQNNKQYYLFKTILIYTPLIICHILN